MGGYILLRFGGWTWYDIRKPISIDERERIILDWWVYFGMGIIRDPIHGFIRFDDAELAVINSPFFQRLRNVKQLALTSYVYPGATHSRFEHSLGVMELCSRIFDSIMRDTHNKAEINKSIKKIGLNETQARKILRLAALQHDQGHLAFSHGAESVLPKGKKHEHISLALIESQNDDIDKLYFNGAAKIVYQLIDDTPIIPELKLLRNIISGSLDADRTDYLIRDSYHCGVDYGVFDHKRLIESLCIVKEEHEALELAIDISGMHALEAMVLARYYMFTQVYFHKTRRIYDYYLSEFMFKYKGQFDDNLLGALAYDDISVFEDMRLTARDETSQYCDIAKRIIERKNHSVILETSEFSDSIERRKLMFVKEKMAKKYTAYQFWVDEKASGNIHKFYIDGEGDDNGDEFKVIRGGKANIVTKYSLVIRKMPKQFHVARLYVLMASGEKMPKNKLLKLRTEALKMYEEERK